MIHLKKLEKRKEMEVRNPEDFEEMEDTFLKERLQSKEPTITTTVRITAGKAKNFNLEVPKTTRPMTDRMKIRIFDILKEDLVNKSILDLYAELALLVSSSFKRCKEFYICRCFKEC